MGLTRTFSASWSGDMSKVEALIVSKFEGIFRPGQTGRTSRRRRMDAASEMYNFLINDDGHLHMPPASELFYTFGTAVEVLSIHYVEDPRGMVVQLSDGKIYHFGIEPATSALVEPASPTLLATIPAAENDGWKIWVNSVNQGYFLMGYAPRGSAGSVDDGKTWKVAGTYLVPTTTDISSTVVVNASYSTLYKGRRFWARRGRQVYFSSLNEYDQPAGADDTFTISGDDAGSSSNDNPGFVSGMVSWENVLIFFLNGSVWMLTGSSPDTYQLSQMQTMVGNAFNQSWTLMRTDYGVLTFGGTSLNNPGIYLFTGSNATKVSRPINDWMSWRGRLYGALSRGMYILASSRSDETERQFLLYNLETQQWVAFDGYVYGVATVRNNEIFIGSEDKVYLARSETFPRKPGRGARIRIGYEDEENPSGLNRYISVKLAGRKWGTGSPTITVTATTSDTTYTSPAVVIPSDVFESMVIPLNIRGAALELDIVVTPVNDDNEVLLENIQVVLSRKMHKASRG